MSLFSASAMRNDALRKYNDYNKQSRRLTAETSSIKKQISQADKYMNNTKKTELNNQKSLWLQTRSTINTEISSLQTALTKETDATKKSELEAQIAELKKQLAEQEAEYNEARTTTETRWEAFETANIDPLHDVEADIEIELNDAQTMAEFWKSTYDKYKQAVSEGLKMFFS